MTHAPWLWLGRPGQETLQRGIAHELAVHDAEQRADVVEAPPCPACDRPVRDEDWERHKYEAHAVNEVAQPRGAFDARELMLLAYSRDGLEEKLAVWRRRHPGARLAPVGDGTLQRGRLVWRRWRVVDPRTGRPVA